VAPRLRPAAELQLADDPERQVLQAVVIDSHRPFSIQNVYADTLDENGEFLQAGDIEKARVLLVHDPAIELEIPDSETTRLAQGDGRVLRRHYTWILNVDYDDGAVEQPCQ